MKDPFAPSDHFVDRHCGPREKDEVEMLNVVGASNIESLMAETVPDDILLAKELKLPKPLSEHQYLKHISEIAQMNKINRSFIGQGYYNTITPAVILRNVLENPGWYTQYTPYQAEISQGRLEALLNFQTMVSELTSLPVANASLLDEGTAAAEAMQMFYSIRNKRLKKDPIKKFFVDKGVFTQTLEVIESRGEMLDIEIVIGDIMAAEDLGQYFAVLVQYPNREGSINDYAELVADLKRNNTFLIVAADLLSLTILKAPGEWGADAVVGTTQRFGIPMGAGGPHAAFFATIENHKRHCPGRIIGISLDSRGKPALRMALQTREQHIKRDKATSNICTAQALLAIMASMYGVYHGPDGLKNIALRIHSMANSLASSLADNGYKIAHPHFFDTLNIEVKQKKIKVIRERALDLGINLFYGDSHVQISVDESMMIEDLDKLLTIFGCDSQLKSGKFNLPESLQRTSEYMTHQVFNSYHSETELMRYIKRLEQRDISLVHSMIPLGSCTMKLNPAATLLPLSWNNIGEVHPFAPIDQLKGYTHIVNELSSYLCEITGFTGCSLQPASGAQGELTGLQLIRAYHDSRNEGHRNIALIPSSAHGTNPASAVMAAMKVVVVACDDHGNIDISDLREKAAHYSDQLAALMVTYPSTHGVFEKAIKEICSVIHEQGGLVYMDGANMNAQVGYTNPGTIGADVCHLNLHKTFSIPHGGGGPGVGPVCVNDKLKPFLPGHPLVETGGSHAIKAVNSGPWGNASVLPISYGYIRMMGAEGLKKATEVAILNSNYIKTRLEGKYSILYIGEKGRTAHEMIVDLRPFKDVGISAEDVAKRLIDYGFHAPTLSFPVPGTIMIEPTESESLEELNRFCDAMLSIYTEIEDIIKGNADPKDNVLANSPHTMDQITANHWDHVYSREQAAFPLPYLREGRKFWPFVSRVDSAYGDRNLVCTCPPISSYVEQS